MPIPALRLRRLNEAPVRPAGDWVLYWMIASRRTHASFALDHAIDRARALGRPLLVLEPLRVDHPWASARTHRFVLQGMGDQARAFAGGPVGYHPYVEPRPGEGRGLLAALAARACLVVTDDWPGFFLPRMVAAAAEALPVALDAVDGAGLLPLRAADHAYGRAVDLRRFLQKVLPTHLAQVPRADPLAHLDLPPCPPLPAELLRRWPAATPAQLRGELGDLPVDAEVGPVAPEGGGTAARARWRRFLAQGLDGYDEDRRHPDRDGGSGLSPWLHFGHLGVHELVGEVLARGGVAPSDLQAGGRGSKEGWWGLPPASEAFLDELVTWRELGLHNAAFDPAAESYAGLPAWARRTLGAHAADPRPILYGLDALEEARTHDPVWNAAQRQLRGEGRIHNHLRMLWGKNVLAWSPSPEVAFQRLVHLNHRWALDGRDPNSTSGITWVFGRYDRPWFPERPIFGTVRFMRSEAARKKVDLEAYLSTWGPGAA